MAANAGPSQVLSPAALTEAVMRVLPETDLANTTLDEFCRRRTRLETRPSRRASTLRNLPRADAVGTLYKKPALQQAAPRGDLIP